jgi:hypothetical protein
MAQWVRTFYTSLPTKTLADACAYAEAQSGAAMKLLTQQVPSSLKMTFKAPASEATTNVEYEQT